MTEPRFSDLPPASEDDLYYGDHLSMAEFREWVRYGFVNDDDGSAYLATATEVSDQSVSCEYIALVEEVPAWATHVVWYSK